MIRDQTWSAGNALRAARAGLNSTAMSTLAGSVTAASWSISDRTSSVSGSEERGIDSADSVSGNQAFDAPSMSGRTCRSQPAGSNRRR